MCIVLLLRHEQIQIKPTTPFDCRSTRCRHTTRRSGGGVSICNGSRRQSPAANERQNCKGEWQRCCNKESANPMGQSPGDANIAAKVLELLAAAPTNTGAASSEGVLSGLFNSAGHTHQSNPSSALLAAGSDIQYRCRKHSMILLKPTLWSDQWSTVLPNDCPLANRTAQIVHCGAALASSNS